MRAVRFANRLSFTISPDTATFIRVAVRKKVFRHLSGERLLREIIFILMENRPLGALRMLSQLGLLTAIREDEDVDLVVEADGITFGRYLQEELGGEIREHQQFKTAVLVLPDGFKSRSRTNPPTRKGFRSFASATRRTV